MRGWTVLVLGLAGCSGSDTEDSGSAPACLADPLTMTMGTGETGFSVLLNGAEAPVVYGPQGGWHLWTAAALTGVGPEVAVLGSIVLEQNGMLLASPENEPQWIDLAGTPGIATYDAGTCGGSFYGIQTRLDDFVPPSGSTVLGVICALAGRTMNFTLQVEDVASGEVVTQTTNVIGRPDPETQQNCAAAP